MMYFDDLNNWPICEYCYLRRGRFVPQKHHDEVNEGLPTKPGSKSSKLFTCTYVWQFNKLPRYKHPFTPMEEVEYI